jgi:hypothetical protein
LLQLVKLCCSCVVAFLSRVRRVRRFLFLLSSSP